MGFHLFVAYNTVHCQNEWERVREMRNRPLVGNPRKYRRVYDSVCVYSVEEWKDESGNHKSF